MGTIGCFNAKDYLQAILTLSPDQKGVFYWFIALLTIFYEWTIISKYVFSNVRTIKAVLLATRWTYYGAMAINITQYLQ